jgi:photosystem II stability/assembly factor-like uncharacterized protein
MIRYTCILLGLAPILVILDSSCAGARHSRMNSLPSAPGVEEPDEGIEEVATEYLLKRSPGGEPVPMERVLAAREHIRRMPVHGVGGKLSKDARASIGGWQFVGPANVGGRTRSLLIRPDDPNTMYAGAVSGGVWKSTDAGASWVSLTDQMGNLAIGSLAMDPTNPDIIYAGTGEIYTGTEVPRGTGMFKTTDGGATWMQLTGTANSQFTDVNKIVVSNDGQRVYAAVSGGVMMSPDGGNTWATSLNLPAPIGACDDLVIRTDQPADYLLTSCDRRGSTGATETVVFRNADAAGSGQWAVVLNAASQWRTTLAIAPSNPSVVYALAASRESGIKSGGMLAVYRSTSSGDPGTWEVRARNTDANTINVSLLSKLADLCSKSSNPERQGTYDNVIAVDPQNQDVVWAGGVGVYRSDDGGATWGLASHSYTMPHPDHHVIVFPPNYDAVTNPVLYTANDGGVWRTTNANAPLQMTCTSTASQLNWIELDQSYGTTQFYHGAPYPGGLAYFGGTQDNGSLRGADADSQHWADLTGGDGGNVAIDPTNVNNIYFQSAGFNLYRSTDGGQTRALAKTGITEASGDFSTLQNLIVIDPNQPQRLWVAGRILWRSDDGAQHWTQASPNFGSRISSIAVATGDSNRMILGAVDGSIYSTAAALSSTKDTSWNKVVPRGNAWITWLTFDPTNPSVAYATAGSYNSGAGSGHVFKSSDGGATWSPSDGAGDTVLPDIPFLTIAVDPLHPNSLYAGSDYGVFFSLDGGASWAWENAGFTDAETEALYIDTSGGMSTLFAFTHGRGVWRVPLGTGSPCTYSLSDHDFAVANYGGDLVLNVATRQDCVWSVVPLSGKAVPLMPTTGSGNATVRIHVPLNNTPNAQSAGGSLAVGDHLVTYRQMSPLTISSPTNVSPQTAADVPALPYVVYEPANQSTFTGSPGPVHSCTGTADNRSLWFRYVASFTGTLQATVAERGDLTPLYDSVLTATRARPVPVTNWPAITGPTARSRTLKSSFPLRRVNPIWWK